MVGTLWLVANAFEHDPDLRAALARHPNARVAEATHGAGVYEAVVTTLAEAVSDEVIGRSVQGRPITLVRVGDPAAPRKVLAVGCIHGNEPAGRGIVDDLRALGPRARGASCCSCAT